MPYDEIVTNEDGEPHARRRPGSPPVPFDFALRVVREEALFPDGPHAPLRLHVFVPFSRAAHALVAARSELVGEEGEVVACRDLAGQFAALDVQGTLAALRREGFQSVAA
jgi:hypothetical protein